MTVFHNFPQILPIIGLPINGIQRYIKLFINIFRSISATNITVRSSTSSDPDPYRALPDNLSVSRICSALDQVQEAVRPVAADFPVAEAAAATDRAPSSASSANSARTVFHDANRSPRYAPFTRVANGLRNGSWAHPYLQPRSSPRRASLTTGIQRRQSGDQLQLPTFRDLTRYHDSCNGIGFFSNYNYHV